MLLQWRVSPGDVVHRTQSVAYIETDKGVIVVESFVDGIVDELLVPAGVRVRVGQPIARVRTAPAA